MLSILFGLAFMVVAGYAVARLGWSRPSPQPIDFAPLDFAPIEPRYLFEVVGESQYQTNLERICGGRTRKGAHHQVLATVWLEDNNPHDPQAVRVEVEGLTVGYFPRAEARGYRARLKRSKARVGPTRCRALIVGGWDRGEHDRGHFGIRLDFSSHATSRSSGGL